MTDTDAYLQRLEESNPLREPLLRSVVQALRLPVGSRGLDAGCGIGLQALLLAEAVGPAGHVTGLDLSPAFIRYAEKVVKTAGLSDRISFREGDLNKLPFDDDSFRLGMECGLRGVSCWRPPASAAGTEAGGKARWHGGYSGMVFAMLAPRISSAGGPAECDRFRACPYCQRKAARVTLLARAGLV